MDEKTRQTVSPVLARVPSGIFILTAADGAGHETGMLASWVQQASFDPPMLTVGVNKSRYLVEWLKNAPRMVLNIVGTTQKQFLSHFGKGFEPDEPAFQGLSVTRSHNDMPVLADAIGYLEGTVVHQMEAGDHVVYLLEITGSSDGSQLDSQKPMVHIRKNGFNY